MPPPFAEQEKIAATLGKIANNSTSCSFVDWSCVDVQDEHLEKLGEALVGNSVVRKVHLNFNPAVTDVGARALEAALPNSNVAALWLDHTGASEASKARPGKQQGLLWSSLAAAPALQRAAPMTTPRAPSQPRSPTQRCPLKWPSRSPRCRCEMDRWAAAGRAR